MRRETDRSKLEAFIDALGNRVTGPGRIYLTGGATAVLHGWRSMTIDIDLKGDPEPSGFFEAIAALKDVGGHPKCTTFGHLKVHHFLDGKTGSD